MRQEVKDFIERHSITTREGCRISLQSVFGDYYTSTMNPYIVITDKGIYDTTNQNIEKHNFSKEECLHIYKELGQWITFYKVLSRLNISMEEYTTFIKISDSFRTPQPVKVYVTEEKKE